jgi:hypothetical protein
VKHALDAIRSAIAIDRATEIGFSFSTAFTCNETSGLLGTKNQIKQAAMNGEAASKPKDHPMTRQRVVIVGLEFVGVFNGAYLRG